VLQNSYNYFNHLSDRLVAARSSTEAAEIGGLTTATLRFVNYPERNARKEVEALLNELAQQPTSGMPEESLRSLVLHGRLIVARLSTVDDLVIRLQAIRTGEQARVLQDTYLNAYARATKQASMFRIMLYITALLLVVYVAYLFIRLRWNAQVLRQRLAFERLIASISTRFISLPLHRIPDDMTEGLAQLVEHSGVDGAQIIIVSASQEADLPRGYASSKSTGVRQDIRFDKLLEFAANWSLKEYEGQGCIYVPAVHELPDSHEKDYLEARNLRSWLAMPIWYGNERLGFVTFDAVETEKHWLQDDIALLRTAVEIFANAIVRERNEAERQVLQARLNHAQRLEAIGTLAGGIAHEFNNILGAILGSGEMALEVLEKSSPANRYVRQIMAAGRRAQDIIEQVLTFGRRRDRQHRQIEVQPIVEEAVNLVRASLSSAVSLQVQLNAPGVWIMGDPTELHQVIMNLCTNAAQAMGGRGVIELALDVFEVSDTWELSHGTLPAGRHVRLAVKDSGEGIEPAAMERIFEPFFTTKPAGQGTGLGLSAVHGIVTSKNGAMNIQSRSGIGTIFEIYLPQLDAVVAFKDNKNGSALTRGHGETVLIVDDDPQLVLLGEEMVAVLGYEPVGFDRSSAALNAFQANPQRFDLVLTDEFMPEMTGTDLAYTLHKIRPELPIVLMTAEANPLQSDRLEAAGIREVLRKPLLLRTMADCLARQMSDATDRLQASRTDT
jgi:signal transduction histidine kinase